MAKCAAKARAKKAEPKAKAKPSAKEVAPQAKPKANGKAKAKGKAQAKRKATAKGKVAPKSTEKAGKNAKAAGKKRSEVSKLQLWFLIFLVFFSDPVPWPRLPLRETGSTAVCTGRSWQRARTVNRLVLRQAKNWPAAGLWFTTSSSSSMSSYTLGKTISMKK